MPHLLTFMQEFRPDSTGNVFGHAWTLGIEEKLYMLWPLLLILLYPFRGRALLYLGGIFIAILLLPRTYARSYGGLIIGAAVAIGLAEPTRWRAWNLLAALPNWSLCLLVAATYTLNIVLLAYFATLVGATVMYVIIEQPCIAFGRRVSKRMGSPAPAIAQPGT